MRRLLAEFSSVISGKYPRRKREKGTKSRTRNQRESRYYNDKTLLLNWHVYKLWTDQWHEVECEWCDLTLFVGYGSLSGASTLTRRPRGVIWFNIKWEFVNLTNQRINHGVVFPLPDWRPRDVFVVSAQHFSPLIMYSGKRSRSRSELFARRCQKVAVLMVFWECLWTIGL